MAEDSLYQNRTPSSFFPNSLLDHVGYRILRRIAPASPRESMGQSKTGWRKLHTMLGPQALEHLARCETVIDFGCGRGEETVELAKLGCKKVIGLDIQPHFLAQGRTAARIAGVSNVEFVERTQEQRADAVISVDAFEHFSEPALMLKKMHLLLRPGGTLYLSFGPTWYHPYGGHLFSVFPWAHLLFTETALCRWRSHIRDDGAMRFKDVAGGLNQMTIKRFEQIVHRGPLIPQSIELVPIRPLARAHNRLTREFTTSVIRAVLKRGEAIR